MFPKVSEEQNQAYSMLKLSNFLHIKYNLGNAVIHLPFTFDYYSFFAFNMIKNTKNNTLQNHGAPWEKQFQSQKPQGTKNASQRNEIL